MLAVGFVGLVINLVSMLLLRSGAKDSLNVKGAYYEVIADAAGSVGVMVAGVLIILTGQPIWDVVVAALIAVFVIIRAVVLGRQVIAVSSPAHPPRHPLAAQRARRPAARRLRRHGRHGCGCPAQRPV